MSYAVILNNITVARGPAAIANDKLEFMSKMFPQNVNGYSQS